MISRCQGDDSQGNDIFAAFKPMGIFCFWRTGNALFPKDIYSPSIYLHPPPPPPNQSSLPFALVSSPLAASAANPYLDIDYSGYLLFPILILENLQ